VGRYVVMSNLIPVVNLPPLTHSSLQTFELCPRQFDAKYRTKTVKFQQSYEGEFGDKAHQDLENYIKASGQYQYTDETHRDTGQNLRDYQWVGEMLLHRAQSRGGYVLAERKFAIGYDRDTSDYWDKTTWLRGKIDITIIYPERREAEVFDLKGLPLDTKLPTPTGWTTMGEVAAGDTLYDRSGAPCTVIAKSTVKNLRCYEIKFDDNTSVVCDEEHLWVLEDGTVLPVTQLQRSMRIPLTAPLLCHDTELPIDPYVLGFWLADGKHTSGEVAKPDDGVWDEVQRRGYEISHDYNEDNAAGKCRVHTVYGLRKQLRKAGLLGNKHIPAQYLRADTEDRIALLQGLVDGDGSVNRKRRQVVFAICDGQLAESVRELVLSLGVRATLRTSKGHGFGKDVLVYSITFTPTWFNPFVLPRKRALAAAIMEPIVDTLGRTWGPRTYRRIASVTEVPSVPTQCIAVDSPDHTFLCTDHFIPTHNTAKKKHDPLQVDLYSVSAMLDYSNVDRVRAGYIWAKLPPAKAIDKPLTYTRDDIQPILNTFAAKTADVQHAWETGNFPPRPNNLCPWCDVGPACEFWKPKPEKRR
jgi:hypothetical protein